MNFEAARVTSKVGHESNVATHIGTAVGVVAGGVVIYLSGGLGTAPVVSILATYLGTGNAVGHLTDRYIVDETATEQIRVGVEHVYLDEERYEAANASSDTRTDEHDGEVITGSSSIVIVKHPASRLTDATDCSGVIRTGSPHIYYGGDQASGAEPGQHLGLVMQAVELALTVRGVVRRPDGDWNTFRGAYNRLKRGMDAAALPERTHLVEDGPLPDVAGDAKRAARIVETVITEASRFRQLFGR